MTKNISQPKMLELARQIWEESKIDDMQAELNVAYENTLQKLRRNCQCCEFYGKNDLCSYFNCPVGYWNLSAEDYSDKLYKD